MLCSKLTGHTRLRYVSAVMCVRLSAFVHREGQVRVEGDAPDTEANKYMPCLLAACSSGVPKVVTTGLDAVVKVRERAVWGAVYHLDTY